MTSAAFTAATAALDPQEAARLLYGLVIPRPIALIGTISANGIANLAPHSFFTAVSSHPPMVMFASTTPAAGRTAKDTLVNITATGEFTVSLCAADLAPQMLVTARDLPPETDEFDAAGLTKGLSQLVRAPWVAAAPAAMECRLTSMQTQGDATVIFGEVLQFHLATGVLRDGRPDATRIDPLARLGGALYSRLGDISLMLRS